MIKAAVAVMLAMAGLTGMTPAEPTPWQYITLDSYTTTAHITEYCPVCKEPQGWQSVEGNRLHNGDCACEWLPIGTKVEIDGNTYTVKDVANDDSIAIFLDDISGVCRCDDDYYGEVKVITRGGWYRIDSAPNPQ